MDAHMVGVSSAERIVGSAELHGWQRDKSAHGGGNGAPHRANSREIRDWQKWVRIEDVGFDKSLK
jgi:predicted alpha/beta hydrolase